MPPLLLRSGFWCALLALLVASPVFAADEELIRLLEEKGYLTQKEANQILADKGGDFTFKPNTPRTEELSVGVMMQFQYNYIQGTNDGGPNPTTRNNFLLNRAYLILEGKLGDGFGGIIVPNFGDGTVRLDHAYLYKMIENPDVSIYAGLRKVRFAKEEYYDTEKLLTVNRSNVTNYWGNDTGTEDEVPEGTEANGSMGFAAQHMGLFADYQIDDNVGLEFSLVNGYASYLPSNNFQNRIGAYFQVRTAWDLADPKEEKLRLEAGLNTGFQPAGNSYWQPTVSGGAVSASNLYIGYSPSDSSSIGLNPYLVFQWEDLTVSTEFLLNWVEHSQLYDNSQLLASQAGATPGSGTAMPLGIIVTPSYRFDEDFEVVFQYAFLNTDGRGVQIDSTVPNAPGVGRLFFNEAQSFYLGFNWYILGEDLKLQIGYNYLNYTGRYMVPTDAVLTPVTPGDGNGGFGGPGYSIHAIRTQLQIIF
ncbi:MAG: hypothetical protein Q7Q73_19700 [Verrucomicrobiota bacterium JB024]|nr:hypothetical protein [Verrucomicrobiota bacterium JB024]